MTKWDKFFLGMAQYMSTASKDPSTQVGAVIVRPDKSVCSVGFNGFPQGIEDSKERLENRELKYKLVVHGEINALSFSRDETMEGYTLYTTPFMPCSRCAGIFIQKKIARVVAPYSDNPRWQEEFKTATEMFLEAGIKVDLVAWPSTQPMGDVTCQSTNLKQKVEPTMSAKKQAKKQQPQPKQSQPKSKKKQAHK